MNRDDIIRMAEEASGGRQPDGWGVMLDHEQLERFAHLVVAAEREACAKAAEQIEREIFDAVGDPRISEFKPKIAFAIRERGAP